MRELEELMQEIAQILQKALDRAEEGSATQQDFALIRSSLGLESKVASTERNPSWD